MAADSKNTGTVEWVQVMYVTDQVFSFVFEDVVDQNSGFLHRIVSKQLKPDPIFWARQQIDS